MFWYDRGAVVCALNGFLNNGGNDIIIVFYRYCYYLIVNISRSHSGTLTVHGGAEDQRMLIFWKPSYSASAVVPFWDLRNSTPFEGVRLPLSNHVILFLKTHYTCLSLLSPVLLSSWDDPSARPYLFRGDTVRTHSYDHTACVMHMKINTTEFSRIANVRYYFYTIAGAPGTLWIFVIRPIVAFETVTFRTKRFLCNFIGSIGPHGYVYTYDQNDTDSKHFVWTLGKYVEWPKWIKTIWLKGRDLEFDKSGVLCDEVHYWSRRNSTKTDKNQTLRSLFTACHRVRSCDSVINTKLQINVRKMYGPTTNSESEMYERIKN